MTIPLDAPGDDPMAVFARWHEEAAGQMADPDGAALATASPDGVPSVRFVLIRGIGNDGVRFFTNYDSRKGVELAANPHAAVAWFAWPVRRQVRIEGTVTVLSPAASDDYFAHRDRGHQIGAHASRQSRPLADRAELESAYATAAAKFEGAEVPRPTRWGGYVLAPTSVELWMQRDDRLHDRFAYRRDGAGWTAVRLAP